MLRAEADGYESASYHRDWADTNAGRLQGCQFTGLHHRRDGHWGLDAGQRSDIPAQVANDLHTDRCRYL